MIPRILHYVWVGPKPITEEAKRLISGWRRLMPDYQVMEWNNDTIDFRHKYLKAAFAVGAWNRVSDYQRMCALLDHGGIYLDTDVEARRSLDPLLENKCFLGFQRKDFPTEMVNGAVLGAEKGHRFIGELKSYFDEKLHGASDIGSFSGPGLITHLLRQNGIDRYHDEPIRVRDVTIYPMRFFYPYHWEQDFSEACVTRDTFCIHLWDHTWKKPPRSPLAKKIRSHFNKWLAFAAPDFAFRRAMTRTRETQTVKPQS